MMKTDSKCYVFLKLFFQNNSKPQPEKRSHILPTFYNLFSASISFRGGYIGRENEEQVEILQQSLSCDETFQDNLFSLSNWELKSSLGSLYTLAFISLKSFGCAFSFKPCIFQIMNNNNKKINQQSSILKKDKNYRKPFTRFFCLFVLNLFGTFLRGAHILLEMSGMLKCFLPKAALVFRSFVTCFAP